MKALLDLGIIFTVTGVIATVGGGLASVATYPYGLPDTTRQCG